MMWLLWVSPLVVSANMRAVMTHTNGIKDKTLPLSLSPEAHKEFIDLMLVLGVGDDTSKNIDDMILMPWEEFKPHCVNHVTKMVSKIDESYTEEEIEAILQHECDLARQNPESRKSGFKSHQACKVFATKLAKARAEEVKTGNTNQYEQFCKEYHHHLQHDPEVPHGSKWKPEDGYVTPESRKPPPPEPAKNHAKQSSWYAVLSMLLVVINI